MSDPESPEQASLPKCHDQRLGFLQTPELGDHNSSSLSAVDWFCVSPKIHMLKPNPHGDGIQSWAFGSSLGPEGRALMNGSNALIKGTQESSLVLSNIWEYSKKMASMNQEAGVHQALNLPTPWSWASQIPKLWENNSVVYKPPSLWYSVITAWTY